MTDGTFDLMNWPLVFWEIVTPALVVFLLTLLTLTTRFLIRPNRDDNVAHKVVDERHTGGEFDRSE